MIPDLQLTISQQSATMSVSLSLQICYCLNPAHKAIGGQFTAHLLGKQVIQFVLNLSSKLSFCV